MNPGRNLSHLTFGERVFLSRIVRVHDFLYQKTRGRIGHHVPGMPPSLLLHTTGARTGISRSTTLTYARDVNDLLVVASWGGAPTAPSWYFNLKAKPTAEVNLGVSRIPVIATLVQPGEPDYARSWRIVNDNNANHYDAYQRRTTRPIPVVRLTPT